MTKREALLRQRLHAAHSFIGALKWSAKSYGSGFSDDVHYRCEDFLKRNKAVAPASVVVLPKTRWEELRRLRCDLMRLNRVEADVRTALSIQRQTQS
jgi:hypothetical protein